jgi:hypothetical protein
MAEMQKGRCLKTDPRTGKAGFVFEIECREYECHFTVESADEGCRVRLEMTADDQVLDRTFFLLESILPRIGEED